MPDWLLWRFLCPVMLLQWQSAAYFALQYCERDSLQCHKQYSNGSCTWKYSLSPNTPSLIMLIAVVKRGS